MYVITYHDIPDEVVFTYEEMAKKIQETGCLGAYEYRMDNAKWIIQKKYFFIETLTCVDAGDWNVRPRYYTYNDPNICQECDNYKYMQGNYCMDCNSCLKCGEIEINCICNS
jgi:hypothetical protein